MLTPNKEHVMINLILQRRKKHLASLEKELTSPSLIRVWERFYEDLLNKYSTGEVKHYG